MNLADTEHEEIKWHSEVLSPRTKRTLSDLSGHSLLQGAYLAGGTGLALQIGHRRSCDLDFFFPSHFKVDDLLRCLASIDTNIVLLSQDIGTLHVTVDRTKVSFLCYNYPQLFPPQVYQGISVADKRDIACMKISAISSRGARRDFVDLYVIAKQYGLENLLSLFDIKYAGIEYNRVHLLKSLSYFREANEDHELEMMSDLNWESIKIFFENEIRHLFSS